MKWKPCYRWKDAAKTAKEVDPWCKESECGTWSIAKVVVWPQTVFVLYRRGVIVDLFETSALAEARAGEG